jgi:hypothetical protein
MLTVEQVYAASHQGKILESSDGKCWIWYSSYTDRFCAAFTNPSVSNGSIFFATILDWIGTYATAEYHLAEYR